MQQRAASTDLSLPSVTRPVGLLVAAADSEPRSAAAAHVERAVEALVVYEASDGPEAIELALRRQPQIALLDVNLPRLGGVDVAVVLRELLPGLRVALYTSDPAGQGQCADEFCLPVLDEPASERTIRWLERQAQSCAPKTQPAALATLSLECSECGYGIARSAPPGRCPMCHSEDAWLYTSWRPFSRPPDAVFV